jgi:GH18 family chitinase
MDPRLAVLTVIEPLESRVLFSTGELIRNGSLEGVVSSADWALSGAFQADARFATVHSGLGYAYLATPSGSAGNSLAGQMYQQVTIPAAAQQLKLSFWTRITTSETTTTAANDLLKVQIWDAAGTTLLHTAATLSNLDKNTDYAKRTYTLPDSLKGQTVRILFDGSTNASLATTFRIDDVGLSTQLPDTSKKVVGYVPSYRQSLFAQMDLNLVTHINYFSVQATTSGGLSSPNVNDANLATVVNAAHAKGVGVSITVGPQSFGTLAADSAARTAFATNIVNYALARNLDGVDIDWEPPATGANYANYALLIDDLYKQTAPHGLKITAAVNPWTQEIPVAATNQMDWVNVMCYDFDFANNSTYEAAIDGMIQWSDYGVEKHKLLMGTPFYGRSGTSWSDTTSKTYASFFNEYSATYGHAPAPDEDEYIDGGGKKWIVNGVTTIQKKMAWVRDNGYGGAMIWELGQDHWDASIPAKYDQYSLLPVINTMLRPPSWLTPAPGSRFDLVAGKFIHSFGNVTFNANAHTSGNPNLAVTINAGATAILGATQRWSSLGIAAGGKLDISDKDLVINYSGASPMGVFNGSNYTGIAGLVQSGYNFSAWDGSGIVTSMAAAKSGLTTVGLAEARDALGVSGAATDVWNGQAVDSTTILIKYTYAGDANLDGMIDGGDYGSIDNHVQVPNAFGFFNGDFNFDGVIDGGDYGIIDNNIQAQGAAL